jgi:WD40 repeat protein
VQFGRLGLALSGDGRYFLTGHTRDSVVRLCEVESGNQVQAFEGHDGGVGGVALSPDGTRAASAGKDGTLRLWDTKTGKELRQFKGTGEKAFCVAFSSDGHRLLSGDGGDGSKSLTRVVSAPGVQEPVGVGHGVGGSNYLVHLWGVESGDEVRTFAGHTRDVTAVVFLPDGRSFLSASMDGSLRLWDADTGKELRRLEHPGGVYDAAVDAAGRRALSAGFGDNLVRLWDLATGREIHRFAGHTRSVLGVAFSPDGRRALSSDADDTLRLWQLPELGAAANPDDPTPPTARDGRPRGS